MVIPCNKCITLMLCRNQSIEYLKNLKNYCNIAECKLERIEKHKHDITDYEKLNRIIPNWEYVVIFNLKKKCSIFKNYYHNIVVKKYPDMFNYSDDRREFHKSLCYYIIGDDSQQFKFTKDISGNIIM